jgi:hypothetical protein
MKKQILFVIATSSMVFFSCRKDGTELTEAKSVPGGEISSAANAPESNLYINPLNYNLEGSYSFDNTLKDGTSQLADAVPSTRLISFGTDRKGNLKSAIYFDSTYGVTIANVPQQTNTSLSVWLKYASPTNSATLVASQSKGPHIGQWLDKYITAVELDNIGAFGDGNGFSVNNSWHHVVITYDGSFIRTYLDGALKSAYPKSGAIAPTTAKYFLGHDFIGRYWKGYMDDLRFYSRTLTSKDVAALYNL